MPRYATHSPGSPPSAAAVELRRCVATRSVASVCVVPALPSHGRSHRFDPCHAHQHKRRGPLESTVRLRGDRAAAPARAWGGRLPPGVCGRPVRSSMPPPQLPQPGRVPPGARPLVKPFPDVPGVLERLRADGVQMAVVSDNWPGLEGLYRQLGLPPHQCVSSMTLPTWSPQRSSSGTAGRPSSAAPTRLPASPGSVPSRTWSP